MRRKPPSPALLGPSLGFRVWDGVPGAMEREHAHTDIELNLLRRGRLRYFLAGSYHTVVPGELVAFWAALPHQLIATEAGSDCVWLTVPLAWLLREPAAAHLVERLLKGALVRETRASDDAATRAWVADFASNDANAVRIVRLEVEARLLRLAHSLGAVAARRARTRGASKRGDSDHVETMAEFMGRHFRDELDVAAIVKPTGLHPRYAMQVFKRALGVGVWDYLLRLRVSQAQRLLLTTDDAVLTIAFNSGFGSVARFYAAFTRVTGMSPRTWRARATAVD